MNARNEAIARRFLSAWDAGGVSVVDELADPDLLVSYTHFSEPMWGADAFKQALRQTHEYFPDMRIEANEVIATDEAAVVRWTYRATHRQGELFGVEARGTVVEVRGITIYRIRDGRVYQEEGVVDNLSLLAQLQGQSESE